MNSKILFVGLIKTKALKVVVLISSCVISVGAMAQTNIPANTPKVPQLAGKLSSEDIQSIRVLGRAVLSTRQGFIPDPTQQTVHQNVKALGASLDNAIKTLFNTPPSVNVGKRSFNVSGSNKPASLIEQSSLHLTGGKGVDPKLLPQPSSVVTPATVASTMPSESAQTGTQTSGIREFDAVRATLDTIRRTNSTLSTTPTRGNAHNEHTAQLLAKSNALQDEVNSAINISSVTSADATRLNALRDRLRPKTLTEVMAERNTALREAGQQVPEPTPSISTITHHR